MLKKAIAISMVTIMTLSTLPGMMANASPPPASVDVSQPDLKAVYNKQDIASAVPIMKSTVSRDNNNVVTLNWDAVPGAVGYNIYDATFKSQQTSAPFKNTYNAPVKLTETPVTSNTYVNGALDGGTNGLVHRLTIKAVAGDGTEFSTATEQIGILAYPNTPYGTRLTSLQGKTLKLPVSDFTNNMEFVGLNIRDDKWQYWCYSALEDPNNPGKIHLFLTRIPAAGDFGATWRTKSEIVHMVGDSYEGPFTEIGVVRTNGKMADPAFTSAHNSRIKYIDGKYVLLYIELRNPIAPETAPPQSIVMETVDPRDLPDGHLPTIPNDESYWTPVTGVNGVADGVVIKSDLAKKKVNNPDILKTQSGTYNIMYKSDTPGGGDLIYKATSNNLTGPYTPTIDSITGNPAAIANQYYLNPSYNTEDHQLFEWKHKYFMLNYDLYSKYTSNEGGTYPGVLWVSRDGEKFDASDAYIAEGVLSDYVKKPSGALSCYGGDSGGTTRMERPYLIFDKNGTPIYFTGTNAWNYDGDENGGTSNVPGLANDNLFRIKPLPMHNIKVSSSANTNGRVTVTKVEGNATRTSTEKGEQYDDVYFTVSPDENYMLKSGTLIATAIDSIGTSINVKIESLGGGQYRLIMPPGDVTITAIFRSALPANISGVNVTQSGTVLQGGTAQFAAEVIGTGGFDGGVTWAVSGNASTYTTINSSGLLTLSPYETASQLTVKATSVDDTTKNGSMTIDIVKNVAVMDSNMTNAVVTASSYFDNNAANYAYPRNVNDGATAYAALTSIAPPAGSSYATTKPAGSDSPSNTYYAGTGAANLMWQPASSPRDTSPWLQFTFNTAQTFNTIISFEGAAHNGDGYLKAYDLQTSTDGANWTTVQQIEYPTPSTLKKIVTLNVPITSKYVRLANITSASATTNFWVLTEIQMFNMPLAPELTVPADITVEATGERTSVNLGKAISPVEAVITNDAPIDFPLGKTVVTWTATNAQGISITKTQSINVVDTKPPVITGSPTSQPNINGWYNQDVTVHFAVYDSGSGIALVTPDTLVSSEGSNQSVTGIAEDRAGNQANTVVGNIHIDKTKPNTSSILSPSAPDGANGWYVHPVTLGLAATDNLAGVAQIAYSLDDGLTWLPYTEPVTITQDGRYTISYRSTDYAGNEEQSKTVSFNLDSTAPVITVMSPIEGSNYLNSGELTPQFMTVDSASGMDDSKTMISLNNKPLQQGEKLSLYTLPLGLNQLNISSGDTAGNTQVVTLTFFTYANIDSLSTLVTRFADMNWIDNAGIATSLKNKLSQGNLEAFINELEAQSGKHITTEASTFLLRDAKAILLSSNP
ncbi:OmpL47-type beta-barrel domain-containing protein [Paenibacillus sp. Soil787]|uniref:OmpL47-type beta-barrel domain-containing protein n=1 Tax=Paenibacillus sp. Soil787 TaxID=1736411 RepID=UPI0006FE95BB|nr:discoidin domain-containing protein [Paenibacillus sp. Soil787]KRF42973.1 hypothetical protein ASG93_20695 [Paenibacillus sp. Soil787]